MKRDVRYLAFFIALTLLFSSLFTPAASDNDPKFANYVNMGENAEKNGYAIPNLFRQDGVYINMERFPLVVKNGIEYVPISMFILYSYIEVSYSRTGDNFFLVNNKNSHYISFNVSEGVATTHDGDRLKLPVEVFNKTRYIPARSVAAVLGLVCESYDDAERGVYAFRVSDGKSDKTLAQLVEPYITGNIELIRPPEPPKPPTPPVELDPLEDIAPRRVALCYANLSYGDMTTVLRVLDGYGIKASFSLTKEDITKRDDLVRRVFVSGHSLLLTASAEGDTPGEYAKSFVEGLEKANAELLNTMRRKTRMCTLPFDIPSEFAADRAFLSAVKEAGYVIFSPNTDTGDGPDFNGGAYSVSGSIKNKITDGFEKEEFATVTALLWCSDNTQYYTADLAGFMSKYKQHWFCAANEALLYNS